MGVDYGHSLASLLGGLNQVIEGANSHSVNVVAQLFGPQRCTAKIFDLSS
jgi:uncharacterized membrane protein YuzA (DUF378 family)